MENTQQFFVAARIKLNEFFRIEARMRNIAPATAGDLHLLQNIGILLQDDDVEFIFVEVGCTEKSGCAAADDEYFFLFQWDKVSRKAVKFLRNFRNGRSIKRPTFCDFVVAAKIRFF